MREYIPRMVKLMRRVEFDTNGGCWLWTGAMQRGYRRGWRLARVAITPAFGSPA